MKNIKIAALQFSCCSQVQENIDKAETMVREAASNGANLILLPELFERPYFCQEKRYDYYDYVPAFDRKSRCPAFSGRCRRTWGRDSGQLL